MGRTPQNTTSTHTLRLRSDASGMVKGLNAVDRELADVVKQLDRVQASSGAVGTGMRGAAQQASNLGKATKRSRANLQNFSYQLQDIAIQAEQGVEPLRIFVQQGSQIAGILGPIPALASAFAGGFLLALQALEQFKGTVLELEEAMELFGKSQEAAQEAGALNEQIVQKNITAYDALARAIAAAADAENKRAQDTLIRSLPIVQELLDHYEALRAEEEEFAVSGVEGQSAIRWSSEYADNLQDAEFYAQGLRDVIRAQAEDQATVLEAFTEELEARGMMNAIITNQIAMLAEKLGIQERITKETEAQAEAYGAGAFEAAFSPEGLAYAERFADEAALFAMSLDEARKHGEEGAKKSKEIADKVSLARQQYDAIINAIQAASTNMDTLIGKTQSWANQAVRGVQALWSFVQNQPPLGPIYGEVGARGDPRQFVDDPYWQDRFFPDPAGMDDKGGGAKKLSEAEKEAKRLAEALAKANEEALNLNNTIVTGFGDVATSAMDNFINSLVAGEFAFKDFARAILADLARMLLRATIVSALMAALGGNPGAPVNAVQSIVQQMAGITQAQPFKFYRKGGVVDGASMFPMSSGIGVMGEAGPEAIMPLSRDSNGNLGVAGPAITIHNYSGHDATVTRVSDKEIEIIIGQARQAAAADFSRSMLTGQGSYAKALESGYSSRRKAV